MNEADRERELFGLQPDEHMQAFVGVFGSKKAFIAGDFDLLACTEETITSVAGMQLRAHSLAAEMLRGKISGYRVEMDRSEHPATFHITTWT